VTPRLLAAVTHLAEPRAQARPPAIVLPETAAPADPPPGRLTPWLPVLLLGIVALLGVRLITDGDMWAHLKTGEYIVQHRAFPDRDPFVYTAGNDRWMIKAWLTQVIFYLLFRAAGFAGLTLFKAALFTLAVGLMWRLGRRVGCPAPAALVVLLLLALVARPRLLERPEVPSFLLLAAALSILVRGTWGRAAYLLVPIQAVWANVHPSFAFGLLLPWPFLADAALRRLRGARQPLRHLALAAILLVPASALNPEGIRLLLHPFRVGRMPTLANIVEMQGLLTVLLRYPEFHVKAEAIAFFALAVGAFIVCALQRRSGNAAGPGMWALVAVAIAMPFRGYRFLPYAGMILAAVILKGLGALAKERPGRAATERRPGWQRVLAPAVCVLLLAPAAWYAARDPRFQFGLGVTPRLFPAGAARFILRTNVRGPLFNDLNLGHYLVWSLFPRHQVFIHAGFWESVSDDLFIARYFASAQDPGVFEGLLSEYHVEFLVLRNRTPRRRLVATDGRWALIYWDEVASVYARRGGANAGLIAAREFRLTHFAQDLSYLDELARDPRTFPAAAAELRRAIREDRENVWAGLSLAFLLKARGRDLEEALEALEVAERGGIRPVKVLVWKAEILARLGRRAAAEAAVQEALRLDPADVTARFVLADLRARAGDGENARRGHTDDLDRSWVVAP